MEPRPAAESHAVLVRWMSLVDANSAGFVHGGTVMKMCDEAAGLSAIKHSRCRVVPAGMDRMTFNEPVHTAYLTMVALDEDGRPAQVPPLLVETPDERRREREAQTRRRNRLAEREELVRGREGDAP